MIGDQEAEFRADIEQRGIRVPIEVIAGQVIVDGRSRWLAAKRLGIKRIPVVSLRHSTAIRPSSICCGLQLSADILRTTSEPAWPEKKWRYLAQVNRQDRARRGGLAGGRGRAKPHNSSADTSAAKLSRDRTKTARTQAATTYGVSERRIRSAQRLRCQAPQLYEQVKSGIQRLAVAHREADREAKRRQRRQQHAGPKQPITADHWEIRQGDCLTEMAQLRRQQCA